MSCLQAPQFLRCFPGSLRLLLLLLPSRPLPPLLPTRPLGPVPSSPPPSCIPLTPCMTHTFPPPSQGKSLKVEFHRLPAGPLLPHDPTAPILDRQEVSPRLWVPGPPLPPPPNSRSPCVLARIPLRTVIVCTSEEESDTSPCMASVFELRKLRPERCYKLSKDLEGAHN